MQLKKKLSDIKLKLEWVERLDLVNDQAPLAPELALKVRHSNYNWGSCVTLSHLLVLYPTWWIVLGNLYYFVV